MKYSFFWTYLMTMLCTMYKPCCSEGKLLWKEIIFLYFICFCSYKLSWSSVDHVECVLRPSQPIYLLQLRPHFSSDVAPHHWELPNDMSSHPKRMDTSIPDCPSTHRKNTLQLHSLTFKVTHRFKWQIFVNVKQLDYTLLRCKLVQLCPTAFKLETYISNIWATIHTFTN
jgi:hypothetical protein